MSRKRPPATGRGDRPAPARPRRDRRTLTILAAVLAVTLAAFLPVLSAGFVNMDDLSYVSANPHVRRGITAEGLRWSLGSLEHAAWQPLAWLSHMLDAQVYGLNPAGHHLTSLLVHLASAALLLLTLRGMTGSLWRSALAAALFAVHPLRVESVAWIAERKDVLAAFFWIAAMAGYLRYLRRPSLLRYGAVMLLLALGLTAKPMPVTLPFALLLLDFWPLGRLRGLTAPPEGSRTRQPGFSLPFLLAEKLPLMALSAASAAVAYVAQSSGGAMAEWESLPAGVRLANTVVSYARYLGKIFLPIELAAFYPYSRGPISPWPVAVSALLLAAVTFLGLLQARRRPFLLTGWLWYLGTLVPVIGIIQFGGHSMADRFTYVPAIGILLIVCWGVPSGRAARAAGAVAAAAVLVLAALTWRQAGFWRDSETLFSRALAVTGENWLAQNNLGVAAFEKGRTQEAIARYRETLRLRPGYPEALNNLGVALARNGQVAEARECYEEVIRLSPSFTKAYNNLGNLLARQGKAAEAIPLYEKAVRLEPGYVNARLNLGLARARLGRREQAAADFREVIRLSPDSADAHLNLAMLLEQEGKIAEAAAHYREAVRYRPDLRAAREGLERVAIAPAGR